MAKSTAVATTTTIAVSSSKTCLCSPTTHPGSFRCSLHRGRRKFMIARSISSSMNKLKLDLSRIMAAKVSVLMKAYLAQIIRPCRRDLRRRRNFKPQPTRFSSDLDDHSNTADDEVSIS